MPLSRYANLLTNPDFQSPSAEDPLRPEGWVLDASAPSEICRARRSVRPERWALEADLRFEDEGRGTVQVITERPVPVTGGSLLAVGGTFRREAEIGAGDSGEPAASVWVAGRWLDTASGGTVGNVMAFPGMNLPEGSDAVRHELIEAPRGADALVLVFVLVGGCARTGRTAPLVISELFLRSVGRAGAQDAAEGEREAPRHRPRRAVPTGPLGLRTPVALTGATLLS
jgi:hypothetical protein